MPPSPIKVGFGLVHVAAASVCVILGWMAVESASPQRRAEPKSLTERYVAVVTFISKVFWNWRLHQNSCKGIKFLAEIRRKKRKEIDNNC